MPPDNELTLAQAAEQLGVGRRRVSQLLQSGRLRCRRVVLGERLIVLIPAEAVREFRRRSPGRPRTRPVQTDGP